MRGKTTVVPINEMLGSYVEGLGPGGAAAFAGRIGVTASAVTRWVNGEIVPADKRAAAIAEALGKSKASIVTALHLAREERAQAQAAGKLEASGNEAIRELTRMLQDMQREFREYGRRLERLERQRSERDEGPEDGRRSR